MVAEVERRNKLQLFCTANMMFADTLSDLVQVVNNMIIFAIVNSMYYILTDESS